MGDLRKKEPALRAAPGMSDAPGIGTGPEFPETSPRAQQEQARLRYLRQECCSGNDLARRGRAATVKGVGDGWWPGDGELAQDQRGDPRLHGLGAGWCHGQ